jgi:hypothetical protein
MNWNEPQIIDIPIVHDQRGNLSVVEGGDLIPFDIKRLYYLYDVPGGDDSWWACPSQFAAVDNCGKR